MKFLRENDINLHRLIHMDYLEPDLSMSSAGKVLFTLVVVAQRMAIQNVVYFCAGYRVCAE